MSSEGVVPPSPLDPAAMSRLHEWGGERLVSRMVHLFLRTTPDRVEQIREGLRRGDPTLAELGAHSLKSSAANLGARRLEAVAGDLERVAARGTLPERDLVQLLEDAYEEAVRALRKSWSEGEEESE